MKTYPVAGKVVWSDGQPAAELAGGSVEFAAVEEQALKVSPRGGIGPDGTFHLTTFRENDGAPAGRYRVLVMPPLTMVDDEKPAPPPIMDPRFRSFRTSKLEVVVEPKANDISLPIERAKKR